MARTDAATRTLTLTLMVDKSTNTVAFAESGKHFVDVLLSLLTLPLATVVRLADNHSDLGSLDDLYGGVEALDADYLLTSACRSMLLRPKNSAIHGLNRLRINVDDPKSARYYTCLCPGKRPFARRISGSRGVCCCKCGRVMYTELKMIAGGGGGGGVFVEGGRFAISDDLFVVPLSDTATCLQQLGIRNWTVLEERTVQITHKEVLQLLNCSLRSKTPLTDVFLQNKARPMVSMGIKLEGEEDNGSSGSAEQESLESNIILKLEHGEDEDEDEDIVSPESGEHASSRSDITLKLVLTSSKKFLYAEANEGFIDLLFSFLVLPIGSIKRQLSGESCFGSLDHLYKSAEDLDSVSCLKKSSKQMLLNPVLPPGFGIKSQLLRIKEEAPSFYVHKHPIKIKNWPCRCLSTTCGAICRCGNSMNLSVNLLDPRDSERYVTGGGRGFSKSSMAYMVTDQLVVKPLSITTALSLRREAKDSVEEIEIAIGAAEALALLRASLTSKTALSDAFLSKANTGSVAPRPFASGPKRLKSCSEQRMEDRIVSLEAEGGHLKKQVSELKAQIARIESDGRLLRAKGLVKDQNLEASKVEADILRQKVTDLKDQIAMAESAHAKKLKVSEDNAECIKKQVTDLKAKILRRDKLTQYYQLKETENAKKLKAMEAKVGLSKDKLNVVRGVIDDLAEKLASPT